MAGVEIHSRRMGISRDCFSKSPQRPRCTVWFPMVGRKIRGCHLEIVLRIFLSKFQEKVSMAACRHGRRRIHGMTPLKSAVPSRHAAAVGVPMSCPQHATVTYSMPMAYHFEKVE
jgi:hypothetical protein